MLAEADLFNYGQQQVTQQQALPHSDESERAILGAILLDPAILLDLEGVLAPDDFYSERHQILFGAMRTLGELCDLRTLQSHLELEGTLKRIGGLAYLAGLDTDLPDITRTATYAEIVKERALRRRLILLAGELIRECLTGTGTALEVAASASMGISRVVDAEISGRGDFVPFGDALSGFLVGVEERKAPEGVLTGLGRLDRVAGPSQRGKLVFVGGRAGVGKTAFMIQMIAQEFIHGRRSAIVSLEQPYRDISSRFLSHLLSIDEIVIKENRISQPQWAVIARLMTEIQQRNSMFIDDESVRSFREIDARVRKIHRVHRMDSVFVDYLSLIKRERTRNTHEEIEEISYDLQRLAKQLEITVVVLLQLNRASAKEGNRRPQPHDCRDAGEQAPHRMILLHRYLNEAGDSEFDGDDGEPDLSEAGDVNMAKNKDGKSVRVKSYYDGNRLRWWDMNDWKAEDHNAPLWTPEGRRWS
jgi:replicative DNA helicase